MTKLVIILVVVYLCFMMFISYEIIKLLLRMIVHLPELIEIIKEELAIWMKK